MAKQKTPAQEQAEMALRDAEKKWGKGWDLLSPAMKEAFVSREIVGLFLSQIPSTLEKEPALKHYAETAREAFNLLDPDEESA